MHGYAMPCRHQCPLLVPNVYLGDITVLGLPLKHFLGFFILGGTCGHFTGSFEQAFLTVKQDCQGFLTPKHLLHVDGPFDYKMLWSNGPPRTQGGAFKYKKENLAVLYTLEQALVLQDALVKWTFSHGGRCFQIQKRKTLQCFTLSNRPSYNAFPPSGMAPHSHIHR